MEPMVRRTEQEVGKDVALEKNNGSQHLLDAIFINPLNHTAEVMVMRTQAGVYYEMGQDSN